jgi:hypothetical protein
MSRQATGARSPERISIAIDVPSPATPSGGSCFRNERRDADVVIAPDPKSQRRVLVAAYVTATRARAAQHSA